MKIAFRVTVALSSFRGDWRKMLLHVP